MAAPIPRRRSFIIVAPIRAGVPTGNRITAERWALRLASLSHDVVVAERWGGEPCDAIVALHAVKSADSATRYRAANPRGALVVGLAGTDVYGDLGASMPALVAADRVIALQERALESLPLEVRAKTRVILQSSEPPVERVAPATDAFEVAVLAHFRGVKDPFLAADAVRQLPGDS